VLWASVMGKWQGQVAWASGMGNLWASSKGNWHGQVYALVNLSLSKVSPVRPV